MTQQITRKDFEIMAPVGSWESLASALNAGADAVYFGIEGLNMRSRSCANFTADDMAEIMPFLKNYCNYFDFDINELTEEKFTVITPDSRKPYKQMYVAN